MKFVKREQKLTETIKMTSPLSGILVLPMDNTDHSYVHERFPPGVKFSGPKSRSQSCVVSNGDVLKTVVQQPQDMQQQQHHYLHQKQKQQQQHDQIDKIDQELILTTNNRTHAQQKHQQYKQYHNQNDRQEQVEIGQYHQQYQTPRDQKVKPGRTSVKDRKLNVSLPSLPFDNYPLTQRKNKNCSFVNNHKMYLKLKGYQINDVYSLNRRRNSDSDSKVNKSLDVSENARRIAIANNIDLPPIYLSDKSPRDKKHQWQMIQEEVWKPQESRKLPSKNAVLPPNSKHLDRELYVPGHRRSRDVNTLKLGKVLTQAKMRELLTQEETEIPSGFYV